MSEWAGTEEAATPETDDVAKPATDGDVGEPQTSDDDSWLD